MLKLGFIGTGNMGGSLASAASKKAGNQILLSNRSREKAEALSAKTGATVLDNAATAKDARYIFIGVKPQTLPEALNSIKAVLKNRSDRYVIVSMVAGTPIDRLHSYLGADCPIIRIMPNIPVKAEEGTILYSCSKQVESDKEKEFLSAMEYAGRFIKLNETLIDAGSAVSGCGPAFAAMFAEALADGGVACGLPRSTANELAAQMLLGSAKLLLSGEYNPEALKDAVCSPGGTTIQGVLALENGAFRSAVSEAVIAAYEKTLSL